MHQKLSTQGNEKKKTTHSLSDVSSNIPLTSLIGAVTVFDLSGIDTLTIKLSNSSEKDTPVEFVLNN